MNRITNVKKKDDVLVFSIYSNISIVNTNDIILYVDECDDIDSIYCSSAENHDYVFSYANSMFTLTEIVREGEAKEVTAEYAYEVSVTSDLVAELDNNMKYLKMVVTTERFANDYADGIYYDPKVLYEAELRKLRSFCSTCLDDKQMQLLMLIVFKRQLLEQAIASSHNKEALQFNLDLCRLLDVNITSRDRECRSNKCVNGICKL